MIGSGILPLSGRLPASSAAHLIIPSDCFIWIAFILNDGGAIGNFCCVI